MSVKPLSIQAPGLTHDQIVDLWNYIHIEPTTTDELCDRWELVNKQSSKWIAEANRQLILNKIEVV